MRIADLNLDIENVLPTAIPTLYARNVPLSISDKIGDIYRDVDVTALKDSEDARIEALPKIRKLAYLVFQHVACSEDGQLLEDAQTEEQIDALPVALVAKIVTACMDVIGDEGKALSQGETGG